MFATMRRREYELLSIAITLTGMIWLGMGFLRAQTQDFLNGNFTAQLADLTSRMTRVENRMDYVLGGVFLLLCSQLVQFSGLVSRRRDTSKS